MGTKRPIPRAVPGTAPGSPASSPTRGIGLRCSPCHDASRCQRTRDRSRSPPPALPVVMLCRDCDLPPPSRGADTPTAGSVYGDGPSGPLPAWTAPGTGARTPPTAASSADTSAMHQPPGWRGHHVPNAANAGRLLRRAATLASVWWYRKDFEPPAAARIDLAPALRVRQLPRHRVAQRPPARGPHGRLSAVRAEAKDLRARGVNRLSCAWTAAAGLSTSRRGCAAAATTSADGGTTPASCARSTCAGSTGLDFVERQRAPEPNCPPAMARCVCGRSSRNYTAGGCQRDGRPARRAAQDASPGSIVPAGGFHLFRDRRRSRTRSSGARRSRTSTRVNLRCPATASIVQTLHAAHRHPEPQGGRERATAAERQARVPARREHARGGPRARRRAQPDEAPRRLRPAARAGREHDPRALPAASVDARAGGPLRVPGLVRGAGLPDVGQPLPQGGGSQAAPSRCATW